MFTVSPSDVIKFDSTDFITVPNDWGTTDNSQIVAIRESGDSEINDSQLKQIYVDIQGVGFAGGVGQELPIIGDGEGARAIVDVNSGRITNAIIAKGGKGYSWGLVDLGTINQSATTAAKLDVIIPPSRGHGFDIYQELGTDRVLVYARFDDSTQDFPIDTKFAQIGLIRNPKVNGSNQNFTENPFTSCESLKILSFSGEVEVGDVISQTTDQGTARGYVVSFDGETKVLKYIQDRSLYYNPQTFDNTDYVGITTSGKKIPFESNLNAITTNDGFLSTIDTNFNGSTETVGSKSVELGVEFTNGVAVSEINNQSGEILYLDNRPVVPRNPRQKEDVKIILEF